MTSISRPAAHLATAALACLAVAACSGGGGAASPSAKPTHSPAAPPAQPTSGPAAIAAITTNWQTFFSGAVPIPRRLALLQNGQLFATFVHSQAKTTLGSLVLAASAKVGSVQLRPPGRASVTYTILLSGRPLESNVVGTAIYTGGSWLVADSTFCGLVRLAYGKTSHLIPAACGS
jgi:hypothetical protein